MPSIERINELLAEVIDNRRLGEIIYYDKTDSTNRRAREYAAARVENKEDFCEFTPFIASRQTEGRGRRGRSFLSEAGGIYLSMLVRPTGTVLDPAKITAETAAKIAPVIERNCGVTIDIKWVNDLYLNGKKLAGILTEGEFDENGNLRYFVVGMGINVYKIAEFEKKMPVATTLEDEIGYAPDIEKITAEIILALINEDYEPDQLISEYRRRSMIVGGEVTVTRGNECYAAKALRILDDYSLLVETEDGSSVALNSGEVSIRMTKV